MPDNTTNGPARLLHLDLLRIVAIFCVVFNHTSSRGYMLFADRVDSALYFPYMAISVLCKVAVPIFFMISGALLLPRQESLGALFTKRILRMVTILLLVSAPYYIWLHSSEGLDFVSFFSYIYSNSASTSLWYLYSYIALLLMMPFLRSMVKTMTKQDFLYLIAGYAMVSGVLPCLEFFLCGIDVSIHKSFTPVLFLAPNIFYALIGYYLEHVLHYRKVSTKTLFWGIVLCVVALGITCLITHQQMQILGDCSTEKQERFFNCFIFLPAIMLYLSAKHVIHALGNGKMRRVLPILGDAVFGVYLIEKFARAITDPVYILLEPVLGSFVASIIWVLAALLTSMIVILLLKNIPVVKKLINRFI